MHLSDFRLPNGHYDEGAILQAAAAIARLTGEEYIFTSESDPYYQLLQEARRLNAEMYAAAAPAELLEAQALLRQAEPWIIESWQRLYDLGYASRYAALQDDEIQTFYELNEHGEQLMRGVLHA